MLPPSSACSRRLKVTITCIRGKGSASHDSPGGGPPHKHSDLTLQHSKQIYNNPNTARHGRQPLRYRCRIWNVWTVSRRQPLHYRCRNLKVWTVIGQSARGRGTQATCIPLSIILVKLKSWRAVEEILHSQPCWKTPRDWIPGNVKFILWEE